MASLGADQGFIKDVQRPRRALPPAVRHVVPVAVGMKRKKRRRELRRGHQVDAARGWVRSTRPNRASRRNSLTMMARGGRVVHGRSLSSGAGGGRGGGVAGTAP